MSERTELVKIIGTDNEEREADIVFVHGLGGNAWSTWHPEESKTDKNFCPMWLGEELPQYGIWSVAYEVEPTRWKKGTTMPLVQRADNIIDLLELDEIGKRPIIFITHSMGGLLVKQMLRNANDSGNKSWQRIVEETKGIVYLSTPHSGSNIASWMKYIGGVLRTSVSVEELEAHNPQLLNLNDYCRDNEKIREIPIIVYCENKKTAGVIVVDKTSANPGVPGVKPIVVDENHISISKPDSTDNRIYKKIKKFILECLRNIQREPIENPSSQIQDFFFEDFEGNVDLWRSTGDCNNCKFTQGLLLVDQTPTEIRVPKSIFYENFLFEVKVTSLQAEINWKVALRFQTRQQEFYFYIVCRRYDDVNFFQLNKLGKDGDLVDLIPPTEIIESRFKPFKTLNTMKLESEGSNLQLYFNDILLDRFRMSYNVEGVLAFLALYGSQVVFDNVRVARLRR